jgi:hypothetical protein
MLVIWVLVTLPVTGPHDALPVFIASSPARSAELLSVSVPNKLGAVADRRRFRFGLPSGLEP